ncbi:Primosomal protein N' [Candidatus Hydrogenisulfobacillus filiaventi]|uniref:Replication restart protein PriA n=1 Tax=Candidatus Hydrogenisulfobacillus filiaventi TaxID=2707344 RepID=A0A6F8ZFX0_9FIRM|nr:Primosomal protein N' [Candidatus Hydrogenisulfobacillus filiaventi]
MAVVEVVVERAVEALDRTLSYEAGNLTVEPGMRVLVPLGRQRATGIVVARDTAAPPRPLKAVLAVLDDRPLLTPALLDLARWMTGRYRCYWPQALAAMVPGAVRRGVRPAPEDPPLLAAGAEPRGPVRARIWTLARETPGLTLSELARRAGVQPAVVRRLWKAGGLAEADAPAPDPPPLLTPAQEAALEAARAAGRRPLLLEGVTGSGKTEVYFALMADALAAGRQALLLVPEIALTPQTVERVRSRFGPRVGIWHSALSDGERVRTWNGVRDGSIPVVVGARSAVFLPFARLGIIVLDEEHESTYKQDDHPRYHTREVAEQRAGLEGARLVLGSATPSVETAWRARQGAMVRARLPARYHGRPLPPVTVVDMRAELAAGNRSMFSRYLLDGISRRLEQGEQVVLFLNRRGFASFYLCRDCGRAVTCPHCAVTLTYHASPSALRCHYCFHSEPVPAVCPHCGSRRIRHFGVGTEQVEEAVARLWPQARVLRADRDTVGTRSQYEALYYRFLHGEADILVGTQMIAKGMDWPGVTLVGAVAADVGLNLPDFRAAERSFQLLVQAAGRAGRGDRPGEVVIQTYNPGHYAIEAAARYDYEGFLEQEIGFRRELGYPPFGCLWLVELRGPDAAAVAGAAQRLAEALRAQAPGVTVRGPAPAPIPRLRGAWRQHLLLAAPDPGRLEAAGVILAAQVPNPPVEMAVTVDPYHML